MSSTSAYAPPTAVNAKTFEEQAAAFESDERIHFNKESGTWRFEDDDGAEMEWDTTKNVWVPVIDDDLVKAQQAAYSVPGVDESTPAAPVLKRTKRKEPEDYTSSTLNAEPATSNKRSKTSEPRKSKNTAVYVTGLPPDTTVDEVVERFSKFGIIMEDDNGNPRVKLYAKEDGSFNGEALVVYFKEGSVNLAVTLLDDAELRLGEPNTRMKVQVAGFKHKQEGKEMEKPRAVDKKKATRRIVKMQRKLEDWDDSDNFGPSADPSEEGPATAIKSRVVVLKYMFTLKELEEDATLLLDLKEDVREECELGDVTNVVLYDKEPDGVMTVKFRDPISAQACVLKMNGRFFAGRQVEASLFTGGERFQRSGVGEDPDDESTAKEGKKQLYDSAQWIMKEGE
ncbi:hypothetical protein M422DRAFT_780920 [Sphaerobolus stellatus SS14]|uniref:RRM domain-containing protein n=1 Tax=Sphaerobolus stellatus (strain SS14) TaxID=990650 RepID=A0A0C9VEZ0_SPHS4|nr:hypothetical protein M422DRAFT_780920 [Sphaerobolus stellatus SS14]